jgi:hypothetical protein
LVGRLEDSDMSNGTSAAMVVHGAQEIQPATLGELRALAEDAARSKFFGGLETGAQAMMVMLAGRDLGFSYTQSLRAFHVIKGKPCLSADGMVAVCLARRDLCEYFRCVEDTDTAVTWETLRVGASPKRETFTMADAQRAGLVNEMYRKYPRRMMGARAKSFLARDVYPELLMGLYDPDEIQEAPIVQMVPAPPASAPQLQERPAPRELPPVSEAARAALEDGSEMATAAQDLLRELEAATTKDDMKRIARAAQVVLREPYVDVVREAYARRNNDLRAATSERRSA